MASTSRAPAATVVPDEIWEEIFLRLDGAADLARASAACSSFRRIASARRFLRRFGSLHFPPVLGFIKYGCREFHPFSPPHRSAREAHALLQAGGDFTYSFLPNPRAWCCRHARDGRVLLHRPRRVPTKIQFEDFLVCDPLHRRYVEIPRIPHDLLVAYNADNATRVLPVLAPATENDGEDSFRVICAVPLNLQDKFMAFVFSSGNQTWRGIISTSSTACVPPQRSFEVMAYYAHGCFYWFMRGMSDLLILELDTSEMKFSLIDVPPHNFYSMHAIVEATDGRLGFLTIGDGTVALYCKNRQNNDVGAQEWQHNKLIPLPKSGINYFWNIVGTAGCYAFIACRNWHEMQDNEYFVLDSKTLFVEKLCPTKNSAIYGFPYARFPPPLALPRV